MMEDNLLQALVHPNLLTQTCPICECTFPRNMMELVIISPMDPAPVVVCRLCVTDNNLKVYNVDKHSTPQKPGRTNSREPDVWDLIAAADFSDEPSPVTKPAGHQTHHSIHSDGGSYG